MEHGTRYSRLSPEQALAGGNEGGPAGFDPWSGLWGLGFRV